MSTMGSGPNGPHRPPPCWGGAGEAPPNRLLVQVRRLTLEAMATRDTGTIATSKLTSKAQTVVPRKIRERLGLRPGDTVRYRITKAGVLIDKRPQTEEDPFVEFVEWAGAEDEEAFKDL